MRNSQSPGRSPRTGKDHKDRKERQAGKAGPSARHKDEPAPKARMGMLTFVLNFLGILLVLAGLDLVLLLSKLSRFWGLPVLALGLIVLWFAQRRPDSGSLLGADAEELREGSEYQSAPFIYYLTLRERMVPFLWMLGLAVVVADLMYNFLKEPSLSGLYHNIASFDLAVIFLGIGLIAYRFVPVSFAKERDFIVLLGGFVFLILILPVMVLDIDPDNNYSYTDSPIVYYFLTVPMIFLLKLFGLNVHAELNEIFYILPDGRTTSVGIAISCAGIYSLSFFISGFIAYLLVEYRKFDIKAALLLVSGIFTAWFANVLRMSIIVYVGHLYGEKWFMFTHKYLGTLFFFTWIFIFWFVIFMVLRRKEPEAEEEIGKRGEKRQKTGRETRKH